MATTTSDNAQHPLFVAPAFGDAPDAALAPLAAAGPGSHGGSRAARLRRRAAARRQGGMVFLGRAGQGRRSQTGVGGPAAGGGGGNRGRAPRAQGSRRALGGGGRRRPAQVVKLVGRRIWTWTGSASRSWATMFDRRLTSCKDLALRGAANTSPYFRFRHPWRLQPNVL